MLFSWNIFKRIESRAIFSFASVDVNWYTSILFTRRVPSKSLTNCPPLWVLSYEFSFLIISKIEGKIKQNSKTKRRSNFGLHKIVPLLTQIFGQCVSKQGGERKHWKIHILFANDSCLKISATNLKFLHFQKRWIGELVGDICF